ncbi:hypothetical protein [Arthrobacter caoxuetaonis]|uniref:Antitoxin Xre/MbcA/ParS-like toxin-binding domain-containing protein n=1 Tax=Arthrobacter caoxuetaonis TaxID=2886935 RepID=A0A9X1MHC7_9MICC|nr:hypothetical protein [Arthrobacter caoxuetaonis]MCC3299270.1 hypothetical protein [Arthrobacter caoxuetaonis]USQ59236.1 hypothetical protein NF551_16770 [Arthrobacter caoxuetaonis]
MDTTSSVPATATDLIESFMRLLSSALSSNPGHTTVDLNGCYISPFADLLDALVTGDAEAQTSAAAKVLAIEEALARTATSTEAAQTKPEAVTPGSLVRALVASLGRTLVAALAGEKDRSVVDGWCREERPAPGPEALERLQCAYEQWQLIEASEGADVARLWFIGMNPRLDGTAPVEAIMEGRFRDVAAAAREMAGGGGWA